ncbi:MAG: hypothetical protein ACTSYB_08865 [Candidatus Helarchaeota archaeon]
MIKKLSGGEVPDFINMSLKANLSINSKRFTLILSPTEPAFVEGHDPFTEFEIIADEQFWHDVFDGKYTFFGGYTRGLVEIPNFRPQRFKVFYISGMLSMLQSLKMKF